MAERTGYTVFRFVDQSGYCHMVSDYVEGRTMMQYVKEARTVRKQQFFRWCVELLQQLERYYKWEDQKAYGNMNPYAVIVTSEGIVRLLDVDDSDNQDLVERMQKKNVRALFVRWEHVRSRKVSREDDSYGLGKTLQFMKEKCRIEGEFTRREERSIQKVIGRCLEGRAAEIKGLKELRREFNTLAEGRQRGRTEENVRKIEEYQEPGGGKSRRNLYVRRRKAGLILLVVVILAAALWERGEKRAQVKQKNVLAAGNSALKKEATELKEEGEEGTGAEEKEKGEGMTEEQLVREARLQLELGLLYCEEIQEYEQGNAYLEMAAEELSVAEVYLLIEKYIRKGENENQVKQELEQAVRQGGKELESEEVSSWLKGKEYLYGLPLLEAYRILDTKDAWQEVAEIAGRLVAAACWGTGEDAKKREQNVREYLAKAYEVLEQPEKAAAEYERVKELESDTARLEVLYLKLEDLYDELDDAEKVWEICRESVEKVPDSEQIWTRYVERHLRDQGIEKEICAETVKRAIKAVPELTKNPEFQKLITEYEIKIEGEEVWIGK